MEIQTNDDFKMVGFLISEGYHLVVKVPGRGWCGVHQMVFTCGLFYNLTRDCAGDGRYCFKTMYEAVQSLSAWDGKGDPPGKWIKHKGITGEYDNPNKLIYETKPID